MNDGVKNSETPDVSFAGNSVSSSSGSSGGAIYAMGCGNDTVCFKEKTENVRFDLNNGMLTLAVTASSTEKIELVLAENTVYTGSEQIVLFTNVGKTVFAYGAVDTINGMSTVNAADYFTGNGISATTQLVYDSTTGVVYLEGVATVPEPTTATLSLLALAGLCARRRRK